MKNEKYSPLPSYLAIGPSPLHGAGVFATEDIPGGITIGISHIYDPNFEHDFIRTPLGGFINHCATPNCELIDDEENMDYKRVKTLQKIQEGDELTLKYSLYKMD